MISRDLALLVVSVFRSPRKVHATGGNCPECTMDSGGVYGCINTGYSEYCTAENGNGGNGCVEWGTCGC